MAANHRDGAQGAPPTSVASKVHDIVEYRGGLDRTLPPTPLKDLLAAGGANVYLLSVDSDLIDTVQRAGGEQYPVFAVPEWSELKSAIDSGKCGIALLDAALLGGKLTKCIAELTRYSARVVTLVAADREAAQELIGLLSERKIHRLLIKPPAFGITRLLLESAVSRCLQLREIAGDRGAHRDLPSRNRGVPTWVLVTAVVALVAGVAAVGVFMRTWQAPLRTTASSSSKSEAAPEVTGVQAAAEAEAQTQTSGSPPAPDRFADLLRRADAAFTQGRLAEPVGDNALDYYLTILAADPMHTLARTRLGVVVDALFTQAESALLDNSLDSAATILEQVRRADPSSARLAFLDAQLERARSEAAAAAAARTTQRQIATTVEQPAAEPVEEPPTAVKSATAAAAAAAAPSELDSLLAIANARLARGQLLEPAGDSARAYVERAIQLARDDSRVLAAQGALGDALLADARSALAGSNVDRAERSATAARSLAASPTAVAALERDIAAAKEAAADRRHEAALATARARLRSGALVDPADDSALFYLTTLRSEGYATAEARGAWSDLTQALTANVRGALDRRDWNMAERALAALRRADPDSPTIGSLQRELETGRLQQQYLATAAPASELKVVRYTAPTYPAEAQARGIEGWVELEYVVDRNGLPRNVVVVGSEPQGRFDQAAISAVSQYQYEPFQRDGQVYERRVRFRVKFALR